MCLGMPYKHDMPVTHGMSYTHGMPYNHPSKHGVHTHPWSAPPRPQTRPRGTCMRHARDQKKRGEKKGGDVTPKTKRDHNVARREDTVQPGARGTCPGSTIRSLSTGDRVGRASGVAEFSERGSRVSDGIGEFS
eukprot:3891308-Rhodomonas_salina.1